MQVEIDIPLNPLYSPVLTIYVYDHVMGFIGRRLLGICNVDLSEIVTLKLAKDYILYKEEMKTNTRTERIYEVELGSGMSDAEEEEERKGQEEIEKFNKMSDNQKSSMAKLEYLMETGEVDLEDEILAVKEEKEKKKA